MIKIIGIFIIGLLMITAVIPAIGSMSIKIDEFNNINPVFTSSDIVWSENFDSYELGQILDGTLDDGGWKLFDDDTQYEGAIIVDDYSRSSPHSVEIAGSVDIVHEFSGLNSGNWVYTDWIYIPQEFSDFSYIALFSYYKTGDLDFRRQLILVIDGINGLIYEDYFGFKDLPLITDQWVELRVEMDFNEDWCECYYNNELLLAMSWSELGWFEGFHNFGAIDIWHFGNIPIYHDDISINGQTNDLESDLECQELLSLNDVQPGKTITSSFTIENLGEPESKLEWIIDEYPEFGTWRCEPSQGSLKPEDGPQTIQLFIEVPDNNNNEFSGELTITSIGNPSDSCSLEISLTTQKNKDIASHIIHFLEMHPRLFPLFKCIFGGLII